MSDQRRIIKDGKLEWMVPLAAYQSERRKRFWYGFVLGAVALRIVQVIAGWLIA